MSSLTSTLATWATPVSAAHGPVANLQGTDSLRLQLATTIDRTDFGVSWNAELPGGGQALGDEVTILAELYFVKEA